LNYSDLEFVSDFDIRNCKGIWDLFMNTCTRLYLVRHGQVVNFSTGVLNGHNDVALSDLGIRQMEAAAARLKDEDLAAVYSSDLKRSKRGGEIIAREHGLAPIISSSLREINFGVWAGLTYAEIQEQYPDALEERIRRFIDYRVSGGESIRDLTGRVVPTVREILAAHQGNHVALVAHGGVNRLILADAMNLDLHNFYSIEQDYGCLNIIDYYQDRAVVKLINGRPSIDF
jgi:alpha-ribazole phosphatase